MQSPVLLLLVKSLVLYSLANSECSVNIRTDIPARDPVYLTLSGGLWAPCGPALTWTDGQESLVACAGFNANSLLLSVTCKLNAEAQFNNNLILTDGERTSTITCVSGTNFTVADSAQNVTSAHQLECQNTITGDFQVTDISCGNGVGSLILLGFSTTLGFTTYIESCYDMITGSVRYTKHPLPGAAISYSVIESRRPAWKSSGTPSHIHPATSYTQASQLTRLTELLGSTAEAWKYLSSTFLARGHMAPDGDGIFRSWSFTTYWYTNAAPKWQVINNGNWVRVENAVRRKAAAMEIDLEIYTGTFGILSLPDINNNQVQITLEEGGNIEVPKWFWKIIRNPLTDEGIALITLNNPFVDSIANSERLCTDICRVTGWFQEAFQDFSRGFTTCCSVIDLGFTINFIPDEAIARGILHF